MDETCNMAKCFTDVETSREHKGCFHSAGDALAIVILGILRGLKNVCQVSGRAAGGRVRDFLAKRFGTERVLCYYWLLRLLKPVEPKSPNRCLAGSGLNLL